MAYGSDGGMIDRRSFAVGSVLAPLIASWPLYAQGALPDAMPVSFGFSPPLSSYLVSETLTRVRTGRGGEVGLRVTRRFSFERFGRGYRLTSTIVNIADTAPPRLSGLIRAGVEPLRNLNIRFILDDKGRTTEVENQDEVWANIDLAVAALADEAYNGANTSPLIQQFSALDHATRKAVLVNEIYDLLRYAGRDNVTGVDIGDSMVSLMEQGQDGWRVTGLAHKISGISWRIERVFIGASPPRHGIVGTSMHLLEDMAPK